MIDKDIILHLAYRKTVVEALVNAMKYGESEIYHIADSKPVSLHEMYYEIIKCLNRKPFLIPYSLVNAGINAAHIIEVFYRCINKAPPVTSDFIRSIFQERVFDISYSSKKIRYHPVDTLANIRKILNH